MASHPQAPLHQEPLADFILIRTDEVDAGERLRPVDPVWAGALGKMMKRDGQDTPIQVCRLPGKTRWTLVVGAHRLAGARAEGIEFLRAEVVTYERDTRRLREVRENLWRSDLTPIDRAAFIAEAVAIWKRRAGIDPTRDGRVASAQARWQKQVAAEADDATATIASVFGWGEKVGEQIGLSARTVRDDLMLYRRLPASVVEELRRHRLPILTNAAQLRALAKLEPGEQAQVVRAMCAVGSGAPRTVAAALAQAKGSWGIPANPEGKRLSSFLGAFSRMGAAEQKGALAELLQQMTPGRREELADLLDPLLPEIEPTAQQLDDELIADAAMIADYLNAGTSGAFLIARFQAHDPEVVVTETDGVHTILMGGVAATSAEGDAALLRAWVATVERRSAAPTAPAAPVKLAAAKAEAKADAKVEKAVAAIPLTLAGEAASDDPAEQALLWLCRPENKDLDPDWLIGEAVWRFGGDCRPVKDGHLLRIGRITSIWPEGGAQLLKGWIRSAASAPAPKARAA